jgi:DNA helicase-2/ATP-dependent DNA helicase PcrA
MEFDIVTLLDAVRDDEEDEGEPEAQAGPELVQAESPGEEANVGYVAVTRAARELNRMDVGKLHRAPTSWDFANDRRRLCYWRYGWVNMEMGLRGDLDPFGFVDPALYDGVAGVEALQEFLLRDARRLEGHKVMLCKQMTDGKSVWHVHLQSVSKPDRLIGRTAPQLTYDLLQVLHGKGYSLPSVIMNLRIASVGTVTSEAELALEEPDRTSRLWLGISLFGTGDFKTRKWKA